MNSQSLCNTESSRVKGVAEIFFVCRKNRPFLRSPPLGSRQSTDAPKPPRLASKRGRHPRACLARAGRLRLRDCHPPLRLVMIVRAPIFFRARRATAVCAMHAANRMPQRPAQPDRHLGSLASLVSRSASLVSIVRASARTRRCSRSRRSRSPRARSSLRSVRCRAEATLATRVRPSSAGRARRTTSQYVREATASRIRIQLPRDTRSVSCVLLASLCLRSAPLRRATVPRSRPASALLC